MRDKNVFAASRALPRMSWSPRNLYNLWQRSLGGKAAESKFERTSLSLFNQRWISKRLVRAYHGDHINEKIFKKWYLPATLPDIRSRKIPKGDSITVAKWAKREDVAESMQKKQEEQQANIALAPVGSLMFTEVERRIDVFIFRCCFAHSVYEARRLVIHGNVKLNGKVHSNANTRLAPGDMVSVDPNAIRFLRRPETRETRKLSPVAEQVEDDQTELERVGRFQPWAKRADLTPFTLPEFAAPFIFIPAYIEPSFATCSAVYVRHPTARPGYSEIPTPYDADGEVVRLAWEWYAKRRPRMRSRSQRAGMPENRQSSD
ncbi:hypothetical protein BU17DRAFT_49698 [Hysterangium stoloniferum]|nr:hypothetical protein BU17DRAFT_49698 [Hysterangium stoloniferum]